MEIEKLKISIIGLGYVGLPLAIEFGKLYDVIGFDINQNRISELVEGYDSTLEVSSSELAGSKKLMFTSDVKKAKHSNFYIVTVPTPIDQYNRPNLSPLFSASKMIGEVLEKGDIVVYESTVYPGATEEECMPILEQTSGLSFNKDFFLGYSPERINPGDKKHRVTNILKITSGSTEKVANFIDKVYKSVITAGTYKAQSIKVAEAAKVIENTQRDVNIALINELSIIFNKLNIDTDSVLKAAATKWNFLPFKPGLVGGHCIGVDPYYLTHKAQSIGYHPEIILAGRRINDGMSLFVVEQLVKKMIKKNISIKGSKVLIMGLSFKENCPDIRNTKVIDIIKELIDYGVNVEVYDPWVNVEEVRKSYNIDLVKNLKKSTYDAIVFAVSHECFKGMSKFEVVPLLKSENVIYDLKGILPKELVDISL